MPLDAIKTLEIVEALENFLDRRRPPVEMREKLDLGYAIEGQSVRIFEIRPMWHNPSEKMESAIAKFTYFKAKNHWKIFWMRANMKWYGYDPHLFAGTIHECLSIVEADVHGCFWG